MKATTKQALDRWQLYRKQLRSDTALDVDMTHAERLTLKKKLEANPPEWIRWIFPKAASADFAFFQLKAIKRLINNEEWFEVLSWARESAKSSIVMMVVSFLVLTGRKKNTILTSYSYDNAEQLLEPFRANLDANNRIKALYGEQKKIGSWESGNFKTKHGAAFKALGAGQNPRGNKTDDFIRPDTILVDDFDTDEDCRNPEIIKKKWDWLENALLPTRSISQPLLVIFCGNIIAKDCCVTRAGKQADHWDVINIRMVDINKPNPKEDFANGKSTWPGKNTEELIDIALRNLSTKAIQQEYFNNPISLGDIFPEMNWGKVPQLKTFKHIILYCDPAYSNTKKKGTSLKAAFLIGQREGVFYVIKGYLDKATNAEFVDWIHFLHNWVNNRTQVYTFIENNKLQDPFYQQVFIPLFAAKRKEHGISISISPDERKKPDKFSRIEGNLEPLNREQRLILNSAEKGNPHMKRLEEQFELINENLSAPADGPDCIEGGYFIANQKITGDAAGGMITSRSITNKKRF